MKQLMLCGASIDVLPKDKFRNLWIDHALELLSTGRPEYIEKVKVLNGELKSGEVAREIELSRSVIG